LIIDPNFDELRPNDCRARKLIRPWLNSGEMDATRCRAGTSSLKIESHRIPGDALVHFWEPMCSKTGSARAADGDVMTVNFNGFGRPLRNPIQSIARATR
jgi:hypothetical protein